MTEPGYTIFFFFMFHEFFAFLPPSLLLLSTELALAAGSAGGRSVSSPSLCVGRTCHRERTGPGVQSWLVVHRDMFSVGDKELI